MIISLENIPSIIFGFLLILVFIIFLIGIFIIVTARGNSQKVESGKKLLFDSFYGLLFVVLIVFVFLLASYFLKKGEIFKPPFSLEKTPPLLVDLNYPSPPRFIKIREFYFNGPRKLKRNNFIINPTVYVILCKKENKYNVVYVGDIQNSEVATNLLKNKQYDCWLNHCEKNLKIFILPFGR